MHTANKHYWERDGRKWRCECGATKAHRPKTWLWKYAMKHPIHAYKTHRAIKELRAIIERNAA